MCIKVHAVGEYKNSDLRDLEVGNHVGVVKRHSFVCQNPHCLKLTCEQVDCFRPMSIAAKCISTHPLGGVSQLAACAARNNA